MSGIPPSKTTKMSEIRIRSRHPAAWTAPIAAATAKESSPSGRTKAISFSTHPRMPREIFAAQPG
jgi:hypothetical protein